MNKRPNILYVLKDNNTPIPEDDPHKWALAFDAINRRVGRHYTEKGLLISTVFLGMDHNFLGGPPILWETMVFDANRDEVAVDRCSGNREQAEAMHMKMVKKYEGTKATLSE